MNPQQLIGIVLIAASIGLVAWSMWPAKKQEPQQPKQADDKDLAKQWGDVHTLIAQLSILLADNVAAKNKLDEVGAALYVESNWSKQDEPSD